MKNISFVLWLVLYPVTLGLEKYFYFLEHNKPCVFDGPVSLLCIAFYTFIAACIYEKR